MGGGSVRPLCGVADARAARGLPAGLGTASTRLGALAHHLGVELRRRPVDEARHVQHRRHRGALALKSEAQPHHTSNRALLALRVAAAALPARHLALRTRVGAVAVRLIRLTLTCRILTLLFVGHLDPPLSGACKNYAVQPPVSDRVAKTLPDEERYDFDTLHPAVTMSTTVPVRRSLARKGGPFSRPRSGIRPESCGKKKW